MKAQILKIAGVKSEKEFYKKYPSEEAFMKKHGKEFKKAQTGVAINASQVHQAAYKPISYQDQFDDVDKMLTGSTAAQRQELALKQQAAAPKDGGGGGGFDIAGLMKLAGSAMQGGKGMGDMGGAAAGSAGASSVAAARYGRDIRKAGYGDAMQSVDMAEMSKDNTWSKVGGALGKYAGPVGSFIGGIGDLQKEKEAARVAAQAKDVSKVSLQAAESIDVDAPIQQSKQIAQNYNNVMQATTGEERANVLGSGTNVLGAARNGRRLQDGGPVGGNSTWTQNTFDPYDIYTDSGFQPLNDSDKKQYAYGGRLHRMLDGGGMSPDLYGQIGSKVTGIGQSMMGGQNAGGKIGETLGKGIGDAIMPGIGGAVLGTVFGLAGNALDPYGKRIKNDNAATQRNMQGMANVNISKGIHAQHDSYVKNGGNIHSYEDGGWVSHDWQPQVIASFGGLDEQEVYDYAHEGMDSLRAGGHLRSYTPPSDRAMETAAFGGQLSLDGPGEIEVMGYNPITASTGASGEIAISRGPSHDTQDKGGDGNKTIANYAGNQVNIEGGETVVEKKDGGSINGDNALNILGDMKIGTQGKVITSDINKQTVSKILKGRDIKDVKFKHVGNDIAKMTKKLNQAENKYIKLTESDDPLKLSTAKAMETGITMQYKDLDKFQNSLIDLQNSYHDTAKEYGYDDTPKFLEDIKKNKVKQQSAKFGGKFTQAQDGKQLTDEELIAEMDAQSERLPELVITKRKPWQVEQIEPDNEYDDYVRSEVEQFAPDRKAEPGATKNSDWWKKAMMAANTALPYFRPSDQESLDMAQLYPEMFAMATNQLTPVQTPPMYQPTPKIYSEINRQAAKNDLIAQTRAAQRQVGYNPAMQAAIAAQAYNPMQQLNEADFIANQTGRDRVYNENASMFDQAKQVNFERFDNQYKRQQEALANTKATTLAALNSIADKYAKNKLEKNTLAAYENMYNYRFGPNFRAQNMNPFAQFDTQYKGASAEELEARAALAKVLEKKEAAAAKKDAKETDKKRNGSIVKSYKNI